MKRSIASLLGHLLAAFVIVSFSATPADTRTICKGPGDGVSYHNAEVWKARTSTPRDANDHVMGKGQVRF